jgi:steroid 5-alpha reductase family enzyme
MSDGAEPTGDRRAEFEAQLAEVRIKSGTAESEQRWMTMGIVTAAVGVVVTIVAFIVSGGQGDTRDVLSSVILGLVGLTFAVVGSAVFLRYSLGKFLRFWMLRLLYEQQADD